MTAPRGPDRRQQPRRASDAAAHYTTELVLALADEVESLIVWDAGEAYMPRDLGERLATAVQARRAALLAAARARV